MGEDFVESFFSIIAVRNVLSHCLAAFRPFYNLVTHQNCNASRSMLLVDVAVKINLRTRIRCSCRLFSQAHSSIMPMDKRVSRIDLVVRTPVVVVHVLHGEKTMLQRDKFPALILNIDVKCTEGTDPVI